MAPEAPPEQQGMASTEGERPFQKIFLVYFFFPHRSGTSFVCFSSKWLPTVLYAPPVAFLTLPLMIGGRIGI